MPLAAAIVAVFIGLLLPWRFGLEWAGRTNWLSAGDIAIALVLLPAIFAAPRRVVRGVQTSCSRATSIALVTLVALALYHARFTPAVAGGGPMPALAVAWAIVAGFSMTFLDRSAFFGGLRFGTWTSALIALLLLSSRPDLVLEHKYFAGLAGAKNTFAFFVAASTLAAVVAAMRWRATGRTFVSFPALAACEIAGGILLLAFSNARAAAVALGASLLVLRGGGRRMVILRGLVVIAAATFAAGAAIPRDRIQFAWSILAHADGIPFLGLGPGFGYGLDTGLKLLLELGPVGFGAFAMLMLGALRGGALSAWIVLIGVYALAHDLTRWPLFWMLLLGCRAGAPCDIVCEPSRRDS